MQINPNFFILARPPFTVIWNYKDHTQFELDSIYSTRLIQLVEDPSQYDDKNEIDSAFAAAGLLSNETFEPLEWGWDELSRIFHIGTKNLPFEQVPQDIHEWSAQYLEHCDQVLDTPAPSARFAETSHNGLIRLPAPVLETASSLNQVLLQRKTSRSFSQQAVALEELSTLLLSLIHI